MDISTWGRLAHDKTSAAKWSPYAQRERVDEYDARFPRQFELSTYDGESTLAHSLPIGWICVAALSVGAIRPMTRPEFSEVN